MCDLANKKVKIAKFLGKDRVLIERVSANKKQYILSGRKWTPEDKNAGDNVYPYACGFSDWFPLQENIPWWWNRFK